MFNPFVDKDELMRYIVEGLDVSSEALMEFKKAEMILWFAQVRFVAMHFIDKTNPVIQKLLAELKDHPEFQDSKTIAGYIAYCMGISSGTVKNFVQVYRAFSEHIDNLIDNGDETILMDGIGKSHYILASETDNPMEALIEFHDKSLSVKEARELVTGRPSKRRCKDIECPVCHNKFSVEV